MPKRSRTPPESLSVAQPDRFDAAGDAVGAQVAEWLRQLYGRGELVPVPEGIAPTARELACHFAMLGFLSEASPRAIELASQMIPVVQSSVPHAAGEPLVLRDSHSATTIAILRALEGMFACHERLPPDAAKATMHVLATLREAIPRAKLSSAFRDPTSDQLKAATNVMRLRVTPSARAGGRNGRSVTARGAAERFALAFGIRAPKSW